MIKTDFMASLEIEIAKVFLLHPELNDHRNKYPWLSGSLGNPDAEVWFVGENPSLGQVERANDPESGPPSREAQWWASRGDKLFRKLLFKHGYKTTAIDRHGGWNCYITNIIKEADYTKYWEKKSRSLLNRAAEIWAPVFQWEIEHGNPKLVVIMGKKVEQHISYLEGKKLISLPKWTLINHYSYIAHRPERKRGLGPMHPIRLQEYDMEIGSLTGLW